MCLADNRTNACTKQLGPRTEIRRTYALKRLTQLVGEVVYDLAVLCLKKEKLARK